MAIRRFSDRVGQEGVYDTGIPFGGGKRPAYVIVTSTTTLPGMITFSAASSAASWSDDDTVTILIKLDNDNYSIWTASWDGTAEELNLVTEEMAVGTIAHEDPVEVSAVLSQTAFLSETRLIRFVDVSQAAYTITADDCGKTIRVVNTSSAQNVVIPDDLQIGFQFNVVQADAYASNITFSGYDVFTTGTVTTATSGQWTMIKVYKCSATDWDCIDVA